MLFRSDNSGFGSNKDEMVVALDIFNHQVIQPYQRIITDVFSPILGEDLTIEMNSPFEIIETAMPTTPTSTALPTTTDTTTGTPAEKVSDVTYNGAQIASALEIVASVSAGTLTQEQAIVFLVQFLGLDVAVAQSMFTTGGDAVAKLSSQKKKSCSEVGCGC